MASRSTFPKTHGSAAPRDALVALVRLLARQAAREVLDHALPVDDRGLAHAADDGVAQA